MAELGLEPQSGTNLVFFKPFYLPWDCYHVTRILSLNLCCIVPFSTCLKVLPLGEFSYNSSQLYNTSEFMKYISYDVSFSLELRKAGPALLACVCRGGEEGGAHWPSIPIFLISGSFVVIFPAHRSARCGPGGLAAQGAAPSFSPFCIYKAYWFLTGRCQLLIN